MIQRVTTGLICATVIVWIVWDFYALKAGGVATTESDTIRRWAQHPLVPFAVGLLMGHLFWCER